jgi:hypothetical protein
MHVLKNGHPAHVFTADHRRKAAAVTNAIRREKRALFEELRLNEEMEQMFARDAASRKRRAEKQRRRRAEQMAQNKARYWIEREYGARLSSARGMSRQ